MDRSWGVLLEGRNLTRRGRVMALRKVMRDELRSLKRIFSFRSLDGDV